jgi:hypothetical protein
MPGHPLHTLIGANHRRVLSVRMRLLEEYALRLLELFRPYESVLTSRAPLQKKTAVKVESEIAWLQVKIRGMKEELGLERSHRNSKREAAALVATMMTYVEELHPRYLKGYGSIPEPVSRYLKECLQEFSENLENLNRALKEDS